MPPITNHFTENLSTGNKMPYYAHKNHILRANTVKNQVNIHFSDRIVALNRVRVNHYIPEITTESISCMNEKTH